MKIKLTLLFICFLYLSSLRSQSYWANRAGGNNVDEALDITKDNSGNIISVGYFTNTADFNTGVSLTSTSPGIPDIFVQKNDANGGLIWVVKAGGNGSDRATAVKTDASGNIYITGFYYGNATFGSITLNSAGGSQDVFIAKLNSNGVFQWAVSAGGNMGEYSYGLALDQSNNVFITGEFKGSATFGTQTITSINNPQTGLASFDIFTAKYNSSGVFQWVRQGSAKYDDRGMDLVCDNGGNVYVTGQFSDTIMFQNTYNNNIMNAVFIIKYDASGQEVWFRKAAGSYGIGYSIALYNNTDLYVCGDYKGTMTFFGSPNNFLSDTYTNRIFLAKYTTSGDFVWAQSDASDNYLSARAIGLTSNGEVFIAGEFGCVMNEYSNLYGTGIFNSVGYTDIFICRYKSDGVRSWERQIGGPLVDRVYGIVEANDGKPVFAGSFEKNIFFPVSTAGLTGYGAGPVAFGLGYYNYCTDQNYGYYFGLYSLGFSDLIVSNGIDLSRQPYDFFIRNGGVCNRPQLYGCIESPLQNNCPDSIHFCNPDNIYIDQYQLGYGISPYYHYQWHGSNTVTADTLSYLYVSQDGYYSITMQSWDGCYTDEDTVYVDIFSMQSPTITDDQGINFQHPPNALPIHACAPDTIVLTGGNIGPYSYSWNPGMPGIIANHDSTIAVDQSGLYSFTLTAPNGCTESNDIYIDLQFNNSIIPKSNMPDTFTVCQGECLSYYLYDSITNPTGTIPYPDCFYFVTETWTASPYLSNSPFNCPLGSSFCPSQTGSYIIHDSLKIQNLCGTEFHTFTDTIYIIVNPKPVVTVSITGDPFICSYDSIYLHASANGPISWPSDSLLVMAPGQYYVSCTITDSVTGCSNSQGVYYNVLLKPDPVLAAVPANSLICPNDSIQLHVAISYGTATNYEWHGPNGIIPGNVNIVYVNVPGFYHCVITDSSGCILTSNTVEVKEYSTPYLVGQPSAIICPGENTQILAVTDASASLVWQAPLSGSSITQTVSTGGIYHCNITSCGITTPCSIEILEGSPTAVATANGSLTFCPGDSVTLSGNPGMAGYIWDPASYSGINYTVYEPGNYYLTTTDQYGCTAISNTITVNWDTSVTPPTAVGDTVCAGDAAVLIASSTQGTLEWYPSFPSSNLLTNSDSLIINPLNNSEVYYATSIDGNGCHSIWIPVYAVVIPTSLPPQIISDTIGCYGDSIQLITNAINGASYNWSGPQSFSSGDQNPIITGITEANEGTYTLFVITPSCTSPASSVVIHIKQALPVSSNGNTILCENDSLELYVHSQHQPVSLFGGPTGQYTALPDSQLIVGSMSSGNYSYIFYETYYGCAGPADTINILVTPRPWLYAAYTNSPICEGDSLYLHVNNIPGTNYSWWGPDNFIASTNVVSIQYADTSLSGTYIVNAIANGCPGDTVSVMVVIHPGTSVNIGNDTTVCSEDNVVLDAGSGYNSYYWNNGSSEQTVPADSNMLYIVTVSNSYGCLASDSAVIAVITCNPTIANIFTPNGDGKNDNFYFAGDQFKDVECTIYDRWGLKIYHWHGTDGFWDGRNLKNIMVPDGTYYYIGYLTDYRDDIHELKGYIQLSR